MVHLMPMHLPQVRKFLLMGFTHGSGWIELRDRYKVDEMALQTQAGNEGPCHKSKQLIGFVVPTRRLL